MKKRIIVAALEKILSKSTLSMTMTKIENNDSIITSLDESILQTKQSLESTLKNSSNLNESDDTNTYPITDELLKRPPFTFIHALVKYYVVQLSFAAGLYSDEELCGCVTFTRRDKIKFLVKILSYVATLTGNRVDIYVSPAKVLSGQDVTTTHLFFRELSRASQISSISTQNAALQTIQNIGESHLYKQLVKTRNAVVKIQQIIRGKLQQWKNIHTAHEVNKLTYQQNIHDFSRKLTKDVIETVFHKITPIQKCIQETQITPVQNCNQETNITTFQNCNQETLITTVSVGIQIDTTPTNPQTPIRTSRPKKKIIQQSTERIISSPPTPKKRTPRRPKYRLKDKIVDGIIIPIPQDEEVIQHNDNNDQENKAENYEQDYKLLYEKYTKNLQKLQERESKLKQKVDEATEKEQLLSIHEARISKLASNLRKQQEKIKQTGLKQAVEMDQMRLHVAEISKQQSSQQQHRAYEIPRMDSNTSYNDMIQRMLENPTLTDLRLKLERKERLLRRREKKLIHIQRSLLKAKAEIANQQQGNLTDTTLNNLSNGTRQKSPPRNKSSRSDALLKRTNSSPSLKRTNSCSSSSTKKGDNKNKNTIEPDVDAKVPPKEKTSIQRRETKVTGLLQQKSKSNDEIPRRLTTYALHYKGIEKKTIETKNERKCVSFCN